MYLYNMIQYEVTPQCQFLIIFSKFWSISRFKDDTDFCIIIILTDQIRF